MRILYTYKYNNALLVL